MKGVLRLVSGLWCSLCDAFGRISPARLVFLGYFFYMSAGACLLSLPVCRLADGPSFLDNLFIAVSAVSTTGLATVSVSGSYSLLGQFIILALIQLGGIGYMTLGSFIVLARHTELTGARARVGRAVFSLPASFDLSEFIRDVVVFTMLIELLGTAALYPIFSNAGDASPLWSALFHSVSSFCTAGFGLYDDSFVSLAGNFWMNLVIGTLSYLGAIGFIVCADYWDKWRGRKADITLTSKIILWATFWLSLLGTVLLFVSEPSIQSDLPCDRLMKAFFQTMAALTTVGFNSVGIGGLSSASILLLIILMVIGAAPSGTGGGLKVTTLTAIMGVIRSALRGDHEVSFWGRPVPAARVWMAVATFGYYLFFLVTGAYLLDLVEKSPFDANFFEVASALGTVGLSMGITAGLSALGKVIIIFMMFVGRMGPIAFGTALFIGKEPSPSHEEDDLAI